MKRLLVFILAVFTISAVFAYEPKVECAKVKRNGDIKYYEKTEPYNRYGLTEPDTDYVQWVIRKDYTVEQHVDYVFQLLESFRWKYISTMKKAETPEPTRFTESVCELKRLLDGTIISPEEEKRKVLLKCAESYKNTAIISLPFITEENFLTITKEEMIEMHNDFLQSVLNK